MMQIATDNRNRPADIRIYFLETAVTWASPAVAWMFERKGLLVVDPAAPPVDEDELLMLALDAGAEDVRTEDGSIEIVTAAEDFEP